jgi:hypothetical protein
MPHRTEQAGIESRQPRQHSGIQPVIFAAAFPDQPHVPRMRHDYFTPQLSQPPADPGRMRPGLQRHAAAWHSAEHLLHRCFGGRQLLLDQHFACLVEHAVVAELIAQIDSDGQFLRAKILLPPPSRCYSFS